MSGQNLPQSVQSNAFCFFTDIAPTIYDLAGLSTSANEGYAPITGKSILPHIADRHVAIYKENEGVGLESGNSSAYFLGGYKIVKNNIPFGDNTWHLHYLPTDPGETKDIASENPVIFQQLLAAYQDYAATVGVIPMPKGYFASKEVGKKSITAMLKPILPFLLSFLIAIIVLFIIWRKKGRTHTA